MAVNISNTKHYKKGDKLPDGSIAKRGVVYNTKTGRPVTGKVLMSAAGQGGMGATKSYKAGRSVSAMKRTASKKNGTGKTNSGGSDSSNPTPPSAAEKARQRRLDQNKGVKGGTIRAGSAGRGVRKYNAKTGRWERVSGVTGVSSVANQNQNQSSSRGGASQRPVSDESKRVSRRAGATPTTTSAAKPGNGSPASKVRQSVISYFQNLGRGSSASTRPTATGTSGVSASAYQKSMAEYEAAKAKGKKTPNPANKVTRRTAQYIYYANGTRKKIS